MNDNYVTPSFGKNDFHCPFCNVHSHQKWGKLRIYNLEDKTYFVTSFYSSECNHCKELSIWLEYEGKMIYPKILTVPIAHNDMPESVKELYEEARNISNDSPRAAATLLRCALEKLTEELGEGEGEGNLYTRIGNLVKRGLPPRVQQALDTVRITANEGGAHSGQIDLTGKDSKEIVDGLFKMVNFIVEKMIKEPREIDEHFFSLPKEKIEGVENRDKTN